MKCRVAMVTNRQSHFHLLMVDKFIRNLQNYILWELLISVREVTASRLQKTRLTNLFTVKFSSGQSFSYSFVQKLDIQNN